MVTRITIHSIWNEEIGELLDTNRLQMLSKNLFLSYHVLCELYDSYSLSY